MTFTTSLPATSFALWSALLLVGATAACERSQACTLIGCQDQASINIRKVNGLAPEATLSLELDGRLVECPAPAAGSSATCDADVTVEARERVSCTEEARDGARVLTCVPTGAFEEVVTIRGTPAAVRVTARSADGFVAERTFQPTYQTSRPNGPDCEPACRQWSEIWTLPEP